MFKIIKCKSFIRAKHFTEISILWDVRRRATRGIKIFVPKAKQNQIFSETTKLMGGEKTLKQNFMIPRR